MRKPRDRPRGHFVPIDSIRGLAALSVVAYHVTFRFPAPRSAFGQLASQRGAGVPMPAVIVFFLISGFVLYRPFAAARLNGEPLPSLLPYAIRRAARIVPAYWVALAITAAWLGQSYVFTAHGLVTYFGFLQLYGSPRTLAGGITPAWTLCVEVTFYIALPLLAALVRRVPGPPARAELGFCAGLALFAIAWQAVVLAVVPGSSTRLFGLLTMLPGSLDLFAAGMALAVLSLTVERRANAVWPWWAAALALLYATDSLGGLYSSGGIQAWWLPTHELKALSAALLLAPLVLGSPGNGPIRRALTWPPLVWLGAVSYGVYLWHQPLLDKLGPHITSWSEAPTILVLAAASVGAAALSFYTVERPAQRFARNWLRRHDRRPDAAGLSGRPVDPVAGVVEPGARSG